MNLISNPILLLVLTIIRVKDRLFWGKKMALTHNKCIPKTIISHLNRKL